MLDRTWSPILTGSDAHEAEVAVNDIAADLRKPGRTDLDASLAGGEAGIALFFLYCDDHREAHACICRAAAKLSNMPTTPHLYSGFTGVAWAVDHVSAMDQSEGATPERAEANSAIDDAIEQYLTSARPPVHFDLISGLGGIAVYLAERLSLPRPTDCAARVVRLLDETSERSGDAITWWTHPSFVGWTPSPMPNGYYNLGVAHGIPGLIGAFTSLQASGCVNDRLLPLLEGAISWVIQQRLPAGGQSSFPFWVPVGEGAASSRLAWCYGDLGIAAVILRAGLVLGREEWYNYGLRLAEEAAARSTGLSGVSDASICHGAAGVAHLFNRMYQATGSEALLLAARRWFHVTLGLREPGRWVGGYYAWEPVAPGELSQMATPGLLTGAAGVGLCLRAGLSDRSPNWDRVLLVDFPSSSGQPGLSQETSARCA